MSARPAPRVRAPLTVDQKVRMLQVTVRELEFCEQAVQAYRAGRSGRRSPDAVIARLGLEERRHRLLLGLVVTMVHEDEGIQKMEPAA